MDSKVRRSPLTSALGALGPFVALGVALLVGRVAVDHGLANTRLLDVLLASVLACGTYMGLVIGRRAKSVSVRTAAYLGGVVSGVYCLVMITIAVVGLR